MSKRGTVGGISGKKRLTAIARLIEEMIGKEPGLLQRQQEGWLSFADIGTDHALLPIALCESGVVSRAIAADVKSGPLAIAKGHIQSAGLEGRIKTRLSDGLMEFVPQEADIFAVCGMGGELILSILDKGEAVARKAGFLVLGPHTKAYELRKGLRERGFAVLEEEMVCEDRKYYPLICVKAETGRETGGSDDAEPEGRTGASDDTARQEMFDRYGKLLLARRHSVLKEFLQKERKRLADIADRASGSRRKALLKQEETCRQAIEYMGG